MFQASNHFFPITSRTTGSINSAIFWWPSTLGCSWSVVHLPTSVPLLLVLVRARSLSAVRHRASIAVAVIAGALDMLANALYLMAVRQGLLSVVAVIASLYPASTVVLAFFIDRERVSRWQAVGLVVGVSALALVSVA